VSAVGTGLERTDPLSVGIGFLYQIFGFLPILLKPIDEDTETIKIGMANSSNGSDGYAPTAFT
jgi:hypothetical protein